MAGLAQTLAMWRGLWRSVRVYHLDRAHHRAMDALYRRFMRRGDLVFDIGAHVGDRISSFRRLGARVVALEPQPGPGAVIRLVHGRDGQVTLLRAAAGPRPGTLTLRVNSANPTVTTASNGFVTAAAGQPGWLEQVWDGSLTVPMTTLDDLIAQHGEPAFVKIDVEGYEDDVLAGLTRPVRALSFEFTTIQRDVAHRALARIAALGPYRFDVALGESQRLTFDEPVDAPTMGRYIDGLPDSANSGDIYAIRTDQNGDG